MAWYEHGARRSESSGSEDRQVAQRALRSKLQLVGGRRPAATDPHKVSYDQIRDNFLDHCKAKGLRSLKTDKEGKQTIATFPRLDKYFSGWKAREITVADLKRFRSEAKAEGLSEARCNRYMATLRAMFNQAVKDELLTRAELPPYFPAVHEPNEARGAIFFKREWYEPMLKQLDEPLRSAFVLIYNYGVRVHEMMRLQWKDVNLKARNVTLAAGITKTAQHRMVPLPQDFGLEPGAPDDLVFPLGNYRWQWYKACVATGAGRWEDMDNGRKRYVGPLLRHCRHTFVRNAWDAGLEDRRIMAITGHVTRSTFDRYNIGKEQDVADFGKDMEKFYRRKV